MHAVIVSSYHSNHTLYKLIQDRVITYLTSQLAVMQKISLLIGLVAVIAANLCWVYAAPLRCDSFLRVVRPDLFTHCTTCNYGSWGGWRRTGRLLTNYQCPTKWSFKEKRTRRDNNGICEENEEFRSICKCIK